MTATTGGPTGSATAQEATPETAASASAPDIAGAGIRPTPTDEEAAAIVAALTMAWPRPAPIGERPVADTRWRFSGRWWNKPTWRH